MIAELNTFVQYFAALYFTICIDTIVTRRFWSSNYYQQVTDTIGLYNFKQSKNIKRKIDNKVKQKADSLRNQATKRGVFMLLVCIAIMLFAAFESDYNNPVYYAIFTYVLLLYCIIMIFSKCVLKNWIVMILLFMVPVVAFLVLSPIISSKYMLNDNGVTPLPNILTVGRWSKELTCLLLIVPILYQLFINWLYSNAYLRHIHCELKKEYERYEKTNLAIEKGDSSLADPIYNEIFAKPFFSGGGKDTVITEFNEAVVKRIIEACEPPKSIKMISSYWKNRKVELPQTPVLEDLDLEDEDDVIPKAPIMAEQDLEQAYIDYKQTTGVKIAKFCEKRNIPEDQFREYRKNRMKVDK